MINREILKGLNNEQFIEMVHKASVLPSNVITFITFAIIFFTIGMAMVKEDRPKFILLWLLSLISLAIIMTVVTMSPHFVQIVSNFLQIN